MIVFIFVHILVHPHPSLCSFSQLMDVERRRRVEDQRTADCEQKQGRQKSIREVCVGCCIDRCEVCVGCCIDGCEVCVGVLY